MSAHREADWLAGLQPGDMVANRIQYSNPARWSIRAVTKVTPTQIVVGHDRYRKSDGRIVGGDSWSTHWIRKPTPEMSEANQAFADRQALHLIFESQRKLSIEAVRAMLEAHAKATGGAA